MEEDGRIHNRPHKKESVPKGTDTYQYISRSKGSQENKEQNN